MHPGKGLIFDKTKPLLDPYARAVTGQSIWGEQPNQDHEYRAPVVVNDFDWGNHVDPIRPIQDLIIYELHVRLVYEGCLFWSQSSWEPLQESKKKSRI